MFAVIAVSLLSVSVLILLVMLLRQNAHIEEVLRATSEQMRNEQARAAVDQESRRQAFETGMKSLESRLQSYQDLLRQWEADRAQKFGRLEQELASASQATLRLQETTGSLSNILGNVKLRGQWGERMAEDIIRYSGLIENVHYLKQVQQAGASTRPDFSFLLPDGKRVNMDVKFPLDNYLRLVNAPNGIEKDTARKEFLKNVRSRIGEIRSRDYINPAENTLDFVLLFIPNEQVFGFVQEMEPGIMDSALKEKVVLCSPFTLYATLAVIRQAHEHFRFEKDLKKIIQLIDQFARYYETFKTRFVDMGRSIAELDRTYADIRDKSFRNLDTKIRHIDDFKKGHMPELSTNDSGVDDGAS